MRRNRFFRAEVLLVTLVIGMTVVGCTTYNHFQSIRNETSSTIAKVYIKDTGSSDWGSIRRVPLINRERGTIAYVDEYTIVNGAQVIFFRDLVNSATPKSITNKDIRVIDTNNLSYSKFDVPIHYNTTKQVNVLMFAGTSTIASSDPITFTLQDRDPLITVQNNTGYTVRFDTGTTLANRSNTRMQARRGSNQENFMVNYSINNFTFFKDVDANSDATVVLTERPPILTVINNTGYNLSVTRPFRVSISNGGQYPHLKESRSVNPLHTIAYQVGNAQYTEQVTLSDADATLTLTKRPPVITIVNNTGNTINLVQIRVPGTSWWDYNLLGLQLEQDGITVNRNRASTNANERSGSIVNRDNFRAWLGLVEIQSNVYDIRVDDVRGDSYVKSNQRITADITLTFTPGDKR